MSDIVLSSLITGIFALLVAIATYGLPLLHKVHTLVNSQMGIQLKLNADNSRWRADTSKKPKDIQAAKKAEAMLREHERKQRKVDK